MECKNCGAVLNEEDRICAACGQEILAEEPETAEMVTVEDGAETTVSEPEEAGEESAEEENEDGMSGEETEELSGEPAKKNTGLIIALVACVAAIAVLLVLLIVGKGDKTPETPVQGSAAYDPLADSSLTDTEQATAYVPAVSYVVDDAAVFDEAFCAQVVATCGNNTLTNEKLAYYYWREVYSFMSNYSSYVSMMMNPYARLDQQESVLTGLSWDEMFMDSALESYHTYAAAAEKGKQEGFVLGEEEQASLARIPDDMEAHAATYGYASADEYIQLSFGPYTSLESYLEFMEEYIYAASYLDHCLDTAEITDDALIALYEGNRAQYEANGLVMDDRPMVNIRHILITPEKVELSAEDEGYEAAKQAALDAAKAKAEEIYAQWQAGEMTEDEFAELATKHSQDGSAAYGGLIQEIAPGQTVENFDAWCFEEGRAVGDHGMVETDFGYHIIYLSEICEESYWHRQMVTEYLNTLFMEICSNLRTEMALTKDMTKAAVYPANVAVTDMAG